MEDILTITCLDDDFLYNDKIGAATLFIGQLCQEAATNHIITLFHKEEKSADIMLETRFWPST